MELDRLTVSRVIDRLYGQLQCLGVRLELSRDFERLERELDSVPEKKLTEHFRRNLNTFTPPKAFWLGGYNDQGQLVALAAARLDELGSWTLEKYWSEYWTRCYPHDDTQQVEPAEHQYRYAKRISGNVAYLGDMWVSGKHPEAGVSGPFSKALQLIALLEWEFNWCYAWVRPSFLERGFAFKCGFNSTPMGMRWRKSPATIDADLRVMANSREDLVDLLEALSFELLAE